jgi:hypothetical protein
MASGDSNENNMFEDANLPACDNVVDVSESNNYTGKHAF